MTQTFEQLLNKFLQDDLNPEELKIFLKTVRQPSNAEIIRHLLTSKLESKSYSGLSRETDMEMRFQQMLERSQGISENSDGVIELYPHKKFFSLKRIAVAVAVIAMLSSGSYFLFFSKPAKRTEVVKMQREGFKNDISPGTYSAKLTLADGRVIVLDSTVNGELPKQGNALVLNKAGSLVYSAAPEVGNPEILYNSLSTVRGETYSTVLADGSKVWLNSESSIKFPVSFPGNERKVEITGEAYFEVTRNSKKPFSVSVNGMQIKVLGTHFNIYAYDDEAKIKTTLLEGSVKVNEADKEVTIRPGQQAILSRVPDTHDRLSVHNNVDLQEVMAWKNGQFYFNGMDIRAVMKQVERWYDVKVIYETSIMERFGGSIPRDVTVSKLLQMLEMTGHVRFRVEGKTITVMK